MQVHDSIIVHDIRYTSKRRRCKIPAYQIFASPNSLTSNYTLRYSSWFLAITV